MYIEYAKYVNACRSIPSELDGLKPVQRRLIYCATKTTGCNRSFVKSARLCGDTMGQYHAHGSSYETLVKMVQAESSPFVGKGNWGSKEADLPPAADRYTEVKLSKVAHEVFLNYIEEVPYQENDLGNSEPKYLTTLVPYCLLAGTSGMGVGCATTMPSFTLKSMLEYISWVAGCKGEKEPILKLSYPRAEYEETLLTKGTGTVKYVPEIRKEQTGTGMRYIITKNPPLGVNAVEKLKRI